MSAALFLLSNFAEKGKTGIVPGPEPLLIGRLHERVESKNIIVSIPDS